ncbi:MAG: type II secretion system protein GspM [Legionella sp.]|nr:type II secretion system protein GspM [Legionella sp.]
MKTYFQNLNEREKWMLIGTGICLFVYIYYFFLYSPLNEKMNLTATQLTVKHETLEWMRRVKAQKNTTKTRKKVENSQLLTLLANQLKENSTIKSPYQLQQTGSGDIQLTFDDVPFKLFMEWLIKMNNQYAISIKQFDAGQTPTPGVSKLMVIITAAA